MISFITGILTVLGVSLLCWILCILTYPSEYEGNPEDFLKKESTLFLCAWISLAIFSLPIALIINKIVDHE